MVAWSPVPPLICDKLEIVGVAAVVVWYAQFDAVEQASVTVVVLPDWEDLWVNESERVELGTETFFFVRQETVEL